MTLLLDGPAIAHELGLDRALVRQWASRGHVHRHGRDARGRTLLDFDEVERVARKRGLLDDHTGTVSAVSAWELQQLAPSMWRVVNVSGDVLRDVAVSIAGDVVVGGDRYWLAQVDELLFREWVDLRGVGFGMHRDGADFRPRVSIGYTRATTQARDLLTLYFDES